MYKNIKLFFYRNAESGTLSCVLILMFFSGPLDAVPLCWMRSLEENTPGTTCVREWHSPLWSPIPWVNVVLIFFSSYGLSLIITPNSIWDFRPTTQPAFPPNKKLITGKSEAKNTTSLDSVSSPVFSNRLQHEFSGKPLT